MGQSLGALGYTGRTAGSGCSLPCPWPPVEASVVKLRPPAPPPLPLQRPLEPHGGPSQERMVTPPPLF